MSVDHYTLLNWAQPWPMGFRGRRKWKLRFATMSELKRLKTCWHEEGKPRVSVETSLKRINEDDWLGLRHSVHGCARLPEIERQPFFLVLHGVIMDGNHRACALLHRGYKGPVLLAESYSKVYSQHLWLPEGEE